MQHIRLKHKFMLNSTIMCKFETIVMINLPMFIIYEDTFSINISETILTSSITKRANTIFDINISDFSGNSAIPNFDLNKFKEKESYNIIKTNDSNEKFDINVSSINCF